MPPQQQLIALLLPAIQAAREGNEDAFEFDLTGSPPGNSSSAPYTLTVMGTLLDAPEPEGDETQRGAQVSIEHDGDTRTANFIFDVGDVSLDMSVMYDFG